MQSIQANPKQQGFTLIELMIVVAIIGILAAIAIPQYQNYIARSQFSEAPTLLSAAQTPVEEQYLRTGNFPDDDAALDDLGVQREGEFGSLSVDNDGDFTIVYTFGQDTDGNDLDVNPSLGDDNETVQYVRVGDGEWECQTSEDAQEFATDACDNDQ